MFGLSMARDFEVPASKVPEVTFGCPALAEPSDGKGPKTRPSKAPSGI
jgi:hypothetical protein